MGLIFLVGLQFAEPRPHFFRLRLVGFQILLLRAAILGCSLEGRGQLGELFRRVVERGLGGFEKDGELALEFFDLRHTEIEGL